MKNSNSDFVYDSKVKSKSRLILGIGIAVIIAIIACFTISTIYVVNTMEPDVSEEYISLESLDYAYAKTAQIAVPSSVIIEAGSSRGSGVVVSDGLILTNDHVISGSSSAIVTIIDENGDYQKYRGNVLAEPDDGKYSKMDLALIQIIDESFDAPAIKLGNMDSVTFGTSAIMVGNPRNVGLLVSKALVSNPSVAIGHPNKDDIFDFIAIDAGVNSGNSGGGLYNIRGELIGIVTLRQVSDEDDNADVSFGIGYAIRIDDVSAYLGRYSQFEFAA